MKFYFKFMILLSSMVSLIEPSLSMEERAHTELEKKGQGKKRRREENPEDKKIKEDPEEKDSPEYFPPDCKIKKEKEEQTPKNNAHDKYELAMQHLKEARSLFQCASAEGHPAAGYELGNLLYGDLGEHEKEAKKCFSRAAKGGDAMAQYRLGLMYENGGISGLPKNDIAATYLFRKAAEQGFSLAMLKYGRRLALGLGTSLGPIESLKIFQKAADAGSVEAMIVIKKVNSIPDDRGEAEVLLAKGLYRAGNRLETGEGIGKDPLMSFRYYCAAAHLGHPGARNRLNTVNSNQPLKKSHWPVQGLNPTESPQSPKLPSGTTQISGNNIAFHPPQNFPGSTPLTQPRRPPALHLHFPPGELSDQALSRPTPSPVFPPSLNHIPSVPLVYLEQVKIEKKEEKK